MTEGSSICTCRVTDPPTLIALELGTKLTTRDCPKARRPMPRSDRSQTAMTAIRSPSLHSLRIALLTMTVPSTTTCRSFATRPALSSPHRRARPLHARPANQHPEDPRS